MASYEIPSREDWITANTMGTAMEPKLYCVTGAKNQKSYVYHVKIGDSYFEAWKYKNFKNTRTKMSIRCQQNKNGCRWTGRVEFRGDESHLLVFDSTALDYRNWQILTSPHAGDHTCTRRAKICVLKG